MQTEPAQHDLESIDMTKLAAWLTRITPRVLQELENCRKSHGFDDYKLQDSPDTNFKHLFTLSAEENHVESNVNFNASTVFYWKWRSIYL